MGPSLKAGIAGGVLAGMLLIGWTIWAQQHGSVVEQKQPQPAPAHPSPTPVVQGPLPVSPPVVKPDEELDPITEPESPTPVTPRKKEAPTGKGHVAPAQVLQTMIQVMHSEAYQHFIQQPGMGMGRMVPMLRTVQREWKTPQWTSEELYKQQSAPRGLNDLGAIHLLSVRFFGDSNAKSEDGPGRATGNSHQKKAFPWEVKSIDLVGIAMHETPVVFISENLPNMKDLSTRPTRELDLFESEGLEELMTGKALYVREKEGTIRVLGPLHAGKACLKCHHDAKEGQMLGAFSYTLRIGQYEWLGRGGLPINPRPPVNSGRPGESKVAPPLPKQ